MKKVRWVMQNNLIAENDLNEIQQACKEADVELQEIRVIPFSTEMPEFTIDDKVNIYYGSTTLMYNIYTQLNKPIGLFYDDEEYSMLNYEDRWGEHMLNYSAVYMTVDAFINSFHDYNIIWGEADEQIFIRPDGDGKEFDGQVGRQEDLSEMLSRHIQYDGPLNGKSKILVGRAYNINKEWRLYIVGGEIVTVSRYRQNFKLSKSSEDIPEDMLQFAKDRINEYIPHENFAMDIASTHDGTYYIIECGCLNSVGFYACDINKLVKSISEWMENQ